MSQPVALTSPVTVPPICAAVRSIPSRMNPVGVHDVAIAAAGTDARAIVAIMAEAEAKPTSRRLVMRLDMLSSDWTRGWFADIPNPDRRLRALPPHGRAERSPIGCAVTATTARAG